MKITAPILLGAFVLAACGSGGHPSSALKYTAPTTLTVAHPQTGTPVRCTFHGISAGAAVPAPRQGVSNAADGKSASAILTLTRDEDGSLSVSCTP